MQMDTLEKIKFVSDLCERISEKIIEQIGEGRIPDDWDGIELRWLIAEHANQNARFGDKRRKAEYDNTVIVNNL
jgi:hypothetical protein